MLSVAIIGRDEANTIGAALQSVSPYAEEIVFIDTGSKDETPQIAESYGAQVKQFEWCDDFSAARNAGVKSCSGKWILSIDCDEILRPLPQFDHFLKSLENNERTLGYTVEISSHLPNGVTDSHHDIRLFRNLPNITYQNPIHESVSGSIYQLRPEEPIGPAGFLIEHYGYASSDRNHEKLSRNLKILRRWIQEHPDEPFAWYKLGMTLKAVSSAEYTAYLFRSFEILLVREDRNSFAFRFELLQALVDSLKSVDQRLSQIVQSQGIRAFA